jgi:hypothetical protein
VLCSICYHGVCGFSYHGSLRSAIWGNIRPLDHRRRNNCIDDIHGYGFWYVTFILLELSKFERPDMIRMRFHVRNGAGA